MSSERYVELFIPPEERHVVADKVKKTLEASDPNFSRQLEHRIIYADGEIGYIAVRFFVVKDSRGRTIRTYGANQDITERKKAEETLIKAENEKATILNTMSELVAYQDAEHRIIWANRAAGESAGSAVEELLGRYCYEIWQERNKPCINCPVEKAWKTGRLETETIHSPNGRVWSIRANPVKNKMGDVVGVVEIILDITERKQAELALRTSEEQYKTILQTTMDGFWLSDMQGHIIEVNDSYCRMSGYSHEELLKMSIAQLEAIEISEEVARHIQKIVTHGADRFETAHRRKNGSIFQVEASVHFLPKEAGRFFCFFRDITERKQAEDKLLEYHKKLKKLTAQLALTEERERRRIARNLHDQVSQSLALAKIKLDTMLASEYASPLAESLKETNDTIEKAIQNTRSLTFDLSYPILYEIGFEAAVAEWLQEQVQKKHAIAVEFEDDGLPKPLDDDVRVLLFRNVRELLINIIKHARAGKVKVSIAKTDDSIKITIEDNGVGLNADEITASRKGGFGLFSIYESIAELGGSFEIESKPGAGCKVTMTAPLKGKRQTKE